MSKEPIPTIRSVGLQQQTLLAERYLIIKQLSRGGMGTIYLAEDLLNNGFPLAIKIIHKNFQSDKQYLDRFKQEVTLCHSVSHPNVIKIFDYVEVQDRVFFTMEHIIGKSLEEHLDEDTYPVEKLAKLIIEIADGLKAIHEKGIVHRDIKPANIMIQLDGSAKIIDFGVSRPKDSKMTQKNFKLGTLCYIAPEVWRGKTPSISSDLYALGILIYEAFTGKLPFESESMEALAKYHSSDMAPELPLSTPPWIVKLISSLLSKWPGDRFASAQDIIDFVQTNSIEGQKVQTFNGGMKEQTIRSGTGIISTFPQFANITHNPTPTFARSTLMLSLKATRSDYEEDVEDQVQHRRSKTIIINLPKNAAIIFEFEYPTREFLYLGFFLGSLNILDGFLTKQGMHTLGTEAEGNALMAELMHAYGVDNALLMTKGIALTVVLAMTIMARKSKVIKDLVGFLSCFYCIAAIIPWIYILYYR